MELIFAAKLARIVALIIVLVDGVFSKDDVFSKTYHTEEEGGTGVFVGNTGKDSGLFSNMGNNFNQLQFKAFTQGNEFISYFFIDESTGVVRTAKNIDRETICPRSLNCSVKLSIGVYQIPPGSQSLVLVLVIEVDIIIDDINDNSPTFPSRVVNLRVSENQKINFQMDTSVATDADAQEENSKITYRFEPPTDVFELSTVKTLDGIEDLVITIKKVLDREVKSLYPLTVIATDFGKPPRTGSVLINVQVVDLNDNSPTFDQMNYVVTIPENSDFKTPVAIVTATDKDEGENARLSYALSSQVSTEIQNLFTVDQNTGKIFSRRELDFETKHVYQFYVVVSDNGSPPRSNFAYVTINVTDTNDNPPTIQVTPAPGGDTVVENGMVGRFLAHIKVSDLDSGVFGNVSCRIDDLNFKLEPVDEISVGIFKITLNQTLDREEAAKRNVAITCVDGGVPALTASASFTVTVEDVNDNYPKFVNGSLFGSVMENGNDDAYVMQVVALDPDVGENSRVTYVISSKNDASLFRINATSGVIFATRMLDRELKGQYQLEVTASDHGAQPLATAAVVTIAILDQNDNPPKFRYQTFINSIVENLPIGSPAGDVTAYDLDTGVNAKFVFSILEQGPGAEDGTFFKINPETGLLKSEIIFDRESKRVYSFQVKVTDPKVDSYYDVTNVTVIVEDDNDHAPVIVKPPPSNRTFRCPFNMTVGGVIATFSATDEDDPKLVEISFLIRSKEAKKNSLFTIDPSSGKLRLARMIRPQDVNSYSLVVAVMDGSGINAKTSTATISIIVEEGSAEAMKAFSEASKTNMVIVIIIIAATLVLAFIVIAVICLIRRVDKKRHAHNPPSATNVDSKLYHAAQWISTVSVTNDPGMDDIRSSLEVPSEKQKKKKEVSFSLDDDVVESPDTSSSIANVFSPAPNPVKRLDALPYQANSKPADFIVINGMSTPDYSQHLYDASETSTDHHDERQFMEVRHTEDRYSDASSGDTGTSDSGRGGSEDESHGHSSSAGSAETRKFKLPSANLAPNSILRPGNQKHDTNSLRRQPQHQVHQVSTQETEDIPGSPTPLLSAVERKSSPHCYIRRSFDKLPAMGLGYPAGASNLPNTSQNNETPTTYHSQPRHSNARVALSNNDFEDPYRVKKAEHNQHLLQTFSSPFATGVPHSSSHPAWKRAKGLDTSWRSNSASCQDDDDNTTTSGSYTVGSEDLKEEVYNPDVMV